MCFVEIGTKGTGIKKLLVLELLGEAAKELDDTVVDCYGIISMIWT